MKSATNSTNKRVVAAVKLTVIKYDIRPRTNSSEVTPTTQKQQPRRTWMTEAVVSLIEGQNGSVTVSHRGKGRWKAKGIQCINSNMAAASSNHSPAAILHMTRRAIKYYLTAEVGELTHRNKAHREMGNMRHNRDREGRGGEVTNEGDRKRGTISNADASGMHGQATGSK